MDRDDPHKAKRIVALAIDESDHSDYAFKYYCEQIHKKGDKIILIHVPDDYSILTGAEEKVRQLKEQAARMDILEKKYKDKLIPLRIEGTFRVGCGKPGQVIVRLSREEQADLVIVGTRGQSKARKLILGSVSTYVISNSPVPVLVCRQKDDPSMTISKQDLPVAQSSTAQ